MWLLGRMLPCMVGDKVMDDDENWENCLLLLCIVDYLFAPAISCDETVYLKVCISNDKYFKIIMILLSIF